VKRRRWGEERRSAHKERSGRLVRTGSALAGVGRLVKSPPYSRARIHDTFPIGTWEGLIRNESLILP